MTCLARYRIVMVVMTERDRDLDYLPAVVYRPNTMFVLLAVVVVVRSGRLMTYPMYFQSHRGCSLCQGRMAEADRRMKTPEVVEGLQNPSRIPQTALVVEVYVN